MRSYLETMLKDLGGHGRPQPATLPALRSEALAGLIATLVTLAHCLSYSALIFSGVLAGGLALGLWAFMVATAIGCLWTAIATTLPPALAGPRNPTAAVMSVLAATVATAVTSRGGSPESAVAHVLLALSLATLLTGLSMWLIGAWRLGQAVRFIPYPVVAGFLAASGWLLIVGGVRVALGRPLDLGMLASLAMGEVARVAIAIAFAGLLIALRARGAGGALLPILFIAVSLGIDLVLMRAGDAGGWFLASPPTTAPWSPLTLLAATSVDWRALAAGYVEILSVAGVAAMSLMLDASTLEAQRRATADVDREFRSTGAANLAAAATGGIAVALAPNASRLIDELGGRHRLAGIAGGLGIAAVLLSGANLATFVPTPVLGGLLAYLGFTVLSEALFKPPARPTVGEALLALLIAAAIIGIGYLGGIVLGLVGACILFALRYSRIDAVRRHLTRAEATSPVDRDQETMQRLREDGRRIHIFWLAGFIFFGSADRICERIRVATSAKGGTERRWVVLDVAGVSGLDAAAMLSFAKLCSWAEMSGVTLVLAGAAPELSAEFARAGLSANALTRIRAFPSRGEALEWCEEELLSLLPRERDEEAQSVIAQWLDAEVAAGSGALIRDRHLERRSLQPGEILCRQGDASDSVEFVATGSVAIIVTDATGRRVRVRRMLGRTIIGEMGFIRGVPRAATVVADTPAVVYALDRARYAALAEREPAVARALIEFVARTLADRLEFANTEMAALQ